MLPFYKKVDKIRCDSKGQILMNNESKRINKMEEWHAGKSIGVLEYRSKFSGLDRII